MQMSPGLQNGDKNTLMPPYCPTWRSTVSSHTDSGRGWSEGDTGPAEEMTGKTVKILLLVKLWSIIQIHILIDEEMLLTVVNIVIVPDQLIPQFCKPQSRQANKTDKRHMEGNFTYPSESTPISARYLSKAASNPNNLLREEIEQRSHHLSDSIQITHNARPLPPVPHKIH